MAEAEPKAKGAGAVAADSGAAGGAEGPEGKLKVTVLAAGSAEVALPLDPLEAEKAPKLGGGAPGQKVGWKVWAHTPKPKPKHYYYSTVSGNRSSDIKQ